ncbi:MAG TPA: hypothetical protein PKD10_18450 [Paracoccaceae bacterium]|nr:hypothetical protein [Paracoccaceae bacterium]HMO73127.1 hypothetical protein [Paracoccaceae bacterium]
MTTHALLATALLFGGMVLFSFGFAAFLLNALPPEMSRPSINRATDAGAKLQFRRLHELSVAVTLVHIGIAGHVLARFVEGAVA